MAPRYQKYHLKWPWTPRQVENLDEMLGIIVKDLSNLSEIVDASVSAAGDSSLTVSNTINNGAFLISSDLEDNSMPYPDSEISDLNVTGNFSVNSTELFVDGAGGKTGFGTNTPAALVNIASQSETEFFLELSAANETNAAVIKITRGHGTLASPTAVGSGDTMSGIDTYGHDGTKYLNATAIVSVVTDSVATDKVPSALLFYTHPNSTSAYREVVRFNHDGRVGIGTTNPVSTLEVSRANGPNYIRVYNDAAGTETGFNLFNNQVSGSNWYWYLPSGSSDFRIYGSADRMIFKATGEIGVGISPVAAFHIKAGSTTAGTAPLKLTSGPVMTVPEAGAIEFDGTDFFLTV